MFKKILLIFVIIFLFLVASVYLFRANIKQYAITTILKSFPLPNVALANIDYDQTAGTLNLEEVKFKNPKGYESEYLLEADSIGMGISIVTKPELRLNISDVDIVNPVFHIERTRMGKWNLIEYSKQLKSLSQKDEDTFDIVRKAYAEEPKKMPEVRLPRTVNINNGALYFVDKFISPGKGHRVDFLPITADITLDYIPKVSSYERIEVKGSCHINKNAGRTIKGVFELYPNAKNTSYALEMNAYGIPLAAVKPYLDKYTPFIVSRGSFNMEAAVKASDGAVDGNYTMELMDLKFAINPRKQGNPFLETSVKKLTLYLTNQRGNVVFDFKQNAKPGGHVKWTLGPIAQRAIGLMAIDTVMDIINKSSGAGQGTPSGGTPPEIIDIFKEILR